MKEKKQNFKDLVVDVQNDVDGAFDKLYNDSFKTAYTTASLLLKNKQDVEDVLQNSYMYVAKYIKDLKNPESFDKWLGVIVKHECQKYISKKKRISDIYKTVKKANDFVISEEELQFEYIEKSEIRDEIQRIVDGLPLDKRACIILFYYEGHSLTEISEILEVPEGTVMSRLYYARKKLEKEFKKLQKKDDTLFGLSVIPLVATLFAYQVKNIVVSEAIKGSVIAAVATADIATISASAAVSSVAGTGTATGVGATASATTATGTAVAGTAVATKVAVVAVAATVVVGGGAVAVNQVKNATNNETTTYISTENTTEEYASVYALEIETTPSTAQPSTVTSAQAEIMLSTEKEKTSAPSVTERQTTTKKPSTTVLTTKESTTVSQTTTKPTTTESTTSKPTTTEKETTTRKPTTTSKPTTTKAVTTTKPADSFSVDGGVLNGYEGSGGNISIPSDVTAIGTSAFEGNTDITSVSMPSGVTRIGLNAFSDCTELSSVNLPSTLESIGVAAFYGCESLTSIDIPSGTETISDEAFSYCSSLKTVTIPDTVTSISDDAFYGSDNVTIRCSEGSYAHTYAETQDINFELI